MLLIGAFAASLSSCSPTPRDCARPDVFCAGLVTDFGSTSEGIAYQAWLGLQDVKSLGLADRIDRIETADTRDRAANISVLADAGYDVIVTVGPSIADETKAAAQKYPNLMFIGVEQPQQTELTNLAGLVFHEEHSGFLAGALAALMTRTGHVSAVCEARYIDAIRRYCDGFRAGARYVSGNVQASVTYREGAAELLFQDSDWGSATAIRQLKEGADIVFAAGGATGDAALEAAERNGALVIGTETDMYDRVPEIRAGLLTSAVNDVRSGIIDLLHLARQGQFPAGQYVGQVGLAPYHDLDSFIPAEARIKIQEIRLGLERNSILMDIPFQSP